MGSLVKLFEGQTKVWNLGKTLTGFISHNQSSAAPQKTKDEEVKRPGSVFALFLKEKNPVLRQKYPNLKQAQIMKLASSMWKTESELTKQRHRQQYNSIMEEYKLTVKDIPRRPSSPFVQFFSERNQSLQYQYPNLTDRMKRASVLWKNLSIVEKQRYNSLYRNKLIEYTNNLSEEDINLIKERREAKNLRQQKSDIRRYGKEALKVRPIAPKQNAYNIFVKEKAGAISDSKNFLKIVSQQWRNMPALEKAAYQKKVEEATKAYEKELADWQKKYDRTSEV